MRKISFVIDSLSNMKSIYMKSFSLVCFLVFYGCLSLYGQRIKYNFNNDWKVYKGDTSGIEAINFDDATWKNVTLPYAWNEDDAFRKDIRDHSISIAWYRKRFRLPPTAQGQKIFIEFEG